MLLSLQEYEPQLELETKLGLETRSVQLWSVPQWEPCSVLHWVIGLGLMEKLKVQRLGQLERKWALWWEFSWELLSGLFRR